jgi:hypothetical protein
MNAAALGPELDAVVGTAFDPVAYQLALSRRFQDGVADGASTQISIGIAIGDLRFALKASQVAAIDTACSATPIPGADDWCIGVAQIRSRVVWLVDLAKVLGTQGQGTTVFLLKHHPFGLVGTLCDIGDEAQILDVAALVRDRLARVQTR